MEGPTAPVIVEGPMDGLRLWWNGIRAWVLYGKSFSSGKAERLQWQTLREPDVTFVVLALDRDECEQEKTRWAYEIAKHTPVKVWECQAKDPGDMDQEEITALAKLAMGRKL